MRSIGRQVRPHVPFISVSGQKILYWKLGRGYHFDINGTIYVFKFISLQNNFFLLIYFLIGRDGPPYISI